MGQSCKLSRSGTGESLAFHPRPSGMPKLKCPFKNELQHRSEKKNYGKPLRLQLSSGQKSKVVQLIPLSFF